MNQIKYSQLISDLGHIGLSEGHVVMVHSSMRAVGGILGGPDVLIQALLDVVGKDGTVMMYTDWESAAQSLTRSDSPEFTSTDNLAELPAFNPATSRAVRAYGILPEFLRTWPNSYRSGNPDASMCAVGGQAEWLCADHPLNYGYGPGSPLAKLVEIEGQVLLIGAPLDTVTLLHYSEHMADLPDKRVIHYQEPLLVNGEKRWVEIEEFDTGNPITPKATETYFLDITQAFLAAGQGRIGHIGRAKSYLFQAAGLHHFAVRWMEQKLR